VKVGYRDGDARGIALGDAHRGIPAKSPDLALEVSHAGFTRIVANNGEQDVVYDLALFLGQSGRFPLALDQIALGDRQLLILDVARHLDDLHAVAHGVWNIVEHIGGADEHHLRQIKGDSEVVVAKS
jgi:hypothetical protein